MGSTGSGSFTDYPGSQGGGRQGGTSGEDRCDRAIGDILLEDISDSQYYISKKTVPNEGASVVLSLDIEKGRLAIKDSGEGLTIGVMPTKYNYLHACMKEGYQYEGVVLYSSKSKFPIVKIDLAPA